MKISSDLLQVIMELHTEEQMEVIQVNWQWQTKQHLQRDGTQKYMVSLSVYKQKVIDNIKEK